jgi:hypothetical protein
MVDKSVTIKDATDQELDSLLIRLRKERELQGLVCDIKRNASPVYLPYDQANVSTEAPIGSLYHIGVKGMRWGIRRASLHGHLEAHPTQKTKEGPNEDYTKSRELKSKGYKNLSTKELKDLTQRMQLEKSLRELTVSDYSKGIDTVKAITAAAGAISAVYALSNTPLGKAIKTGIEKKLSKQMKMPGF